MLKNLNKIKFKVEIKNSTKNNCQTKVIPSCTTYNNIPVNCPRLENSFQKKSLSPLVISRCKGLKGIVQNCCDKVYIFNCRHIPAFLSYIMKDCVVKKKGILKISTIVLPFPHTVSCLANVKIEI